MPYRVDVDAASEDALDRLVALGALDVERTERGLAALMPDAVPPPDVARALGVATVRVTPAIGRDADSVWVLAPRAVRVAGLVIAPAGDPAPAGHPGHAGDPAPAGVLRLVDAPAFGTGLHPTTALCLEAIRDAVGDFRPARLLDVGTGSGILALAALMMDVPRAVGLDLDERAVLAASANATLNGLAARCLVVRGGVHAIGGAWPLVVANVQAAPLVELAPAIAHRLAHGGRLVLSGVAEGLAPDVEGAYIRLGMRLIGRATRAGWALLVLQPTW